MDFNNLVAKTDQKTVKIVISMLVYIIVKIAKLKKIEKEHIINLIKSND